MRTSSSSRVFRLLHHVSLDPGCGFVYNKERCVQIVQIQEIQTFDLQIKSLCYNSFNGIFQIRSNFVENSGIDYEKFIEVCHGTIYH